MTFPRSRFPFLDSTPEHRSIPSGRTFSMANLTFSGWIPPDRNAGIVHAWISFSATFQSLTLPVPPNLTLLLLDSTESNNMASAPAVILRKE